MGYFAFRTVKSLVAFAILSLWVSSASALCVSDFAYDYVMRADSPAPAQSLPCCIASAEPFMAIDKDRPIEGRIPSTGGDLPAFAHVAGPRLRPSPSPLRWLSYCKRSSRLLR